LGGTIFDQQGIDTADFVARIQPDRYQIAPRDDPAGAEFPLYALGLFCSFVAPFDLEQDVQARWDEDLALGGVRLDLPNVDRYLLGRLGRTPDAFSWHMVLERSRQGDFIHRRQTCAPQPPGTSARRGWWEEALRALRKR